MKRCLLVVVFLLASAHAATPVSEQAYRRVGEKLICQCGCMQTVYGCNHYGCPQSDTLRKETREAIAATSSEDDAVEVMVKRYGPKILTEPQRTGFSLTAWVMPFFALGAGACIIMGILQKWRSQTRVRDTASAKKPVDPALIDKYAKTMDEEIEKD